MLRIFWVRLFKVQSGSLYKLCLMIGKTVNLKVRIMFDQLFLLSFNVVWHRKLFCLSWQVSTNFFPFTWHIFWFGFWSMLYDLHSNVERRREPYRIIFWMPVPQFRYRLVYYEAFAVWKPNNSDLIRGIRQLLQSNFLRFVSE